MSNYPRDLDKMRAEFRQKLARYPDWDREEQIRKNQSAIETMQNWLNKEVSQEEEAARNSHYRIFEEIIESEFNEPKQ